MSTNEQSQMSGPSLGVRGKLGLGFAALLATLIFLGAESIALLSDLGGSIEVILRENYRSVIACERMKESLERMDSAALFALGGEVERGRALAAQNRPRFEEALQTERSNITLPGEGERAERLPIPDPTTSPHPRHDAGSNRGSNETARALQCE